MSYFRSKLAMTTFITKHTLYEKMPQVAILTLLKGAFRWSLGQLASKCSISTLRAIAQLGFYFFVLHVMQLKGGGGFSLHYSQV